jgi:hypothetical protein
LRKQQAPGSLLRSLLLSSSNKPRTPRCLVLLLQSTCLILRPPLRCLACLLSCQRCSLRCCSILQCRRAGCCKLILLQGPQALLRLEVERLE